ncbi:aldose 1-epimerase-like protein [Leishmania tarentolae]|uniref:Aldose 1-epimerase-like protein n=1 Tax=Leishmania tarentolae TaxID=5689 RepID=A0A640KSK9_LEITA|nr:aldose 1-epimerase-like protein [Leishmania tarentolae]
MTLQVEVRPFGAGKLVWLKTAVLRVGLANFGAAISSVQVFHPQRRKWIEVNCAFPESAAETEADTDYMGVTVGRCGGRVAHATFKLDGVTYHTDKNMNGGHTCHGGHNAFHKKHWGFAISETATEIGVTFNYTSAHMENGFPSELVSKVTYSIERTKPNVLKTVYDAYIPETSAADATPVNIFNHAYWNLNGVPERNGKGKTAWEQPKSVHNHWLRVPASRVAEANRMAIPTGEYLSVDGTSLDFRKGRVLKDGMNDPALNRDPCGYDHPLAIDGWEKGKLLLHAEAKSPATNICMKVYSTFPCMWVYTANNKPLPASGGPGQRYARWTGMGLEPQYFPDGANHYPKYPSCIVRRGKNRFMETILNEFSVDCDSKM